MTEISTILSQIVAQEKIAANAIVCPTMSEEDLATLTNALMSINRLSTHGLAWVSGQPAVEPGNRWTKTL